MRIRRTELAIAIDSWRIETLSFLYCFLHGCQINMRSQYVYIFVLIVKV